MLFASLTGMNHLPAISSSLSESFSRGAGVDSSGLYALLASIGAAVALVVFAYVALGLLDMIERGDRDAQAQVPWLLLRMVVLVAILLVVFAV